VDIEYTKVVDKTNAKCFKKKNLRKNFLKYVERISKKLHAKRLETAYVTAY